MGGVQTCSWLRQLPRPRARFSSIAGSTQPQIPASKNDMGVESHAMRMIPANTLRCCADVLYIGEGNERNLNEDAPVAAFGVSP
jgi:hypothetical protein